MRTVKFRRFRPIWVVIERDVLAVVHTKTFWFFATLYPLFMGFIFLLAPLNDSLSTVFDEEPEQTAWRYDYFSDSQKKMIQDMLFGDSLHFAIQDDTGVLYKYLRYALIADGLQQFGLARRASDFLQMEFEDPHSLERHFNSGSVGLFKEVRKDEDSSETLDSWEADDKIDGYFIIPKNLLTTNETVRFIRQETVSIRLAEKIEKLQIWFQRIVAQAVQTYRLDTAGIAPKLHSELLDGVDLSIERLRRNVPTASAADTPSTIPFQDTNLYQVVSAVLVLGFIFVLIGTSNAAITCTIEEKSNRLSEILVSCVAPSHILDGKLLANAIIALIGILVFCVVLGPIIGLIAMFSEFAAEFVAALINPIKVFNWILFLFLGIAFYGYFEISLGSLCNSAKETMMSLYPVRFFYTFATWPIVYLVVNKPSGTLAEILSFVPIFTPYVMIARADSLPSWPVYVGIVLLMVLSILVVRKITANLFANGILQENTTTALSRMFKLARQAP